MPGYKVLARAWEEPLCVVFAGEDAATGAPVLIKVMRSAPRGEHNGHALARDHRITLSYAGPGAVQTLGCIEHEGQVFLILADDGARPAAELFMLRRLDVGAVLQIGAALASCMEQLHEAGIVHNNLNPFSIWFDSRSSAAWIADFSLAERASEFRSFSSNLARLRGDPRYISPEQTGRTSQPVDARSDLYAVGILLYHALTGAPPFAGSMLETVHAHLAMQPAAPSMVDRTIPRPLSGIVLKLLSKSPEERYQSARGLRLDLQRCLVQWRTRGAIEPFALAANDLSATLRIPQTLYGREEEVALLHAAFDRAAGGASELVLVAGPPGIGKSELVRTVEPSVKERGAFIAAKFDQFKRNEPYAFVAQSFRQLVQLLLASTDDAIGAWKDRLLVALGVNGRVILDVVPELELIIGQQPSIEALPAAEKRNRFFHAFRSLVHVFAREGHPLCMFLDDLQWADPASLALLDALLTDPEMRYLLIIGAYRDTDEGAAEIRSVVDGLAATGVSVTTAELAPLDAARIEDLLRDALHCRPGEAIQLAELILQKTDGNPFFVSQFLAFLHRRRLLAFDHAAERWAWDLGTIASEGITDDVVELMTRKLASLSGPALDALRTASCMGSAFDARQLALVTGRSEAEILDALRSVQAEGLIIATGGEPGTALRFRFLHDRVQQAAYDIIPNNERPAARLRIGTALLDALPAGERESSVPFGILDNLNEGAGLVEDPVLRDEIVRLNLQAGRRARESAAYDAADAYFRSGMALLRPECWKTQYALTCDLHLERFECAYVTGQTDEANRLFDAILRHVNTNIEKSKAYYTKILLSTGVEHSERAVALGIEALALFGVRLTARPSKLAIVRELLRVDLLRAAGGLRGRRAESLLSLPAMTKAERQAVLALLMSICPAAYYRNPDLMALAALRIVAISLRHGNARASAFGYVLYGLVIGAVLGRYRTGHRFGRLAVELAEREGSLALRAKVLMIFASFVNFWREPFATSVEILRASLRCAHDTGDVQYANYSILQIVFFELARGANLDGIRVFCSEHASFVAQTKYGFAVLNLGFHFQFVLALQDASRPGTALDRDGFDEAAGVQACRAMGQLTSLAYYHALKTQLCFLLGDADQAWSHAQDASAYVSTALGQVTVAEHFFYGGLAAAARLRKAAGPPAPAWQALKRSRAKLERWARSCPANFAAQSLLLQAELAGLKGRVAQAELLYDRAVDSAAAAGHAQIEALANELAGEAYLTRGRRPIARTYLEAALAAYQRWGAAAKVAVLQARHADLLAVAAVPLPSQGPWGADSGLADFDTLVRASAELSTQGEFDHAIAGLMRLVLESAGGQRGIFVTQDGGGLHVRAVGTAEGGQVRLQNALAADAAAHCSEQVIRYVLRTGNALILDEAGADPRFAQCLYVRSRRSRSMLCVPLARSGKIIGAVCVENDLLAAGFAPDRVQPVGMLAHQVASVLENADLSRQLSANAADLQDARQSIAILETMKSHLANFVPKAVQDLIEANPSSPDLGTSAADVTVMFLDMVGYTSLSERLPGDELSALIETYFSSFIDDIHANGGDISDVAGDGLMTVFRDPDPGLHARRAVQTALAVQEKTARLNAELAGKWPKVLINIGINSGVVLLGAHKIQGAGGVRWTFTVTGFPANLAARIGAFATQDAILAGEATAAHIADGFELSALGPQRFKGISVPVEVFEVLGVRRYDEKAAG